ncbi:hypothetical protein DFH06DRAFT_1352188 [Mycena polygramma]|nr:hypothetical protein DFH06DRAFT_1352188 [Mycena polygramma]
MSDFNFINRDGFHPSPIFSTKNGANWCSLNGTPDEIDPATSVSILSPPTPWIATTSLETMGIARDPNFLQYAAIYSPTEHYLGWMPMKALEDVEDPAAIAFDATPVDLYDHYTDVQRAGGSDDSGSPRFVGYYFKEEWVNNIAYLSGRLRHIVVTLALSTDWYGPNAWTLEVGDLPGEMDYQLLRMFQTNRAEASRTSGEARRCLLALMAFIAWFTSILPSWRDELQQDDKELVESLRLEERRKRGYAFKLSRDYHEWNVQHLLEHDIGCHYIWTDDEKCSGRFVRYSPEFWGEYMALRRETNTSGPLDLSALPSYAKWQSDLNRFDVFFQDKMMGRPGEVITAFNSACDYRIVDFLYYGARVLENWHVLRAYAERMKAKIVRAKIPNANDVCTFYRQDPIAQDEPADARPRLEERPFKLTDFANEEVGAKVSEEEAYFESTVIIRERVKNRYAPRSNRVYNTFNGGPKKPGSRHTFSRLSSSRVAFATSR